MHRPAGRDSPAPEDDATERNERPQQPPGCDAEPRIELLPEGHQDDTPAIEAEQLGRGAGDATAATGGNFIRAVPFAAVLSLAAASQSSPDPMGLMYAVASGAVTSGLGYVLWYAALPALTAAAAARPRPPRETSPVPEERCATAV